MPRTGERIPGGSDGPGRRGWEGGGTTDRAEPGSASGKGSRLWPILITVGLALVFLVNGIFIYIAVKGADEVVPSYLTEER